MQRRQILGGAYPLASQDLVSLKSIIIKNEITMDYINSWFDKCCWMRFVCSRNYPKHIRGHQ